MSRSLRPLLLIGVLSFSAMIVYTQYVFLQTTDHVTGRPFRDASLDQYHETLEGRRAYPFQWRVAGPWLVRAGEAATGLEPHQIDIIAKVLALAVSTLVLMAFTSRFSTPLAAVAGGALYLALTASAYSSEGYAIYYTNDFLMVMGWFLAVYFAAQERFVAVAVVTFLTAWAKETIVLAPILIALLWWRGKAPLSQVVVCAVAFLIPTAFLRWYYPAELQNWAWVGNISLNIPFIRPDAEHVIQALRTNLKVLMLFNVLWVLAYRTFRRTSNLFARDLAWVGAIYLAILYVVVYLRELRHLMPLAIVIVPLAMVELERSLRTPDE
jgi:hypothetical protein